MIAFLTEMGFNGKISADHRNMRTEFAWMYALNADHFNLNQYNQINNYDHVFVIFPKGEVYLNAVGVGLSNKINPVSELLALNIVETIKKNNKKVYYVQEGPHWLYNDYELIDQVNFYNMLASCDSIFAHNTADTRYYKGLLPHKNVNVLPTLMIEDVVCNIKPVAENKVIVGGNFARWYGGFESYLVAQEFDVDIWGQTSHCKRQHEEQFIKHLPRVDWLGWMTQLSSFKYAVHLMPTVAAGTFSLNCAYFGIPCIGNINVDTQKLCHPSLSVDVYDIAKARKLANDLKNDTNFYKQCSDEAKSNYEKYFNITLFKQKLFDILHND